jgi:glutathione synthase/RimK-type ligase-like ATP-grasp enzyme
MTDITLLTDSRYVNPVNPDWYVKNILEEDRLVQQALERHGLTVHRTHWDNNNYNWSRTRYALFRTTWDYFNRFGEFMQWLNSTKQQTHFINPFQLIIWNLDKHYLHELHQHGIAIPPTHFIEQGEKKTLAELVNQTGWEECILKPAVSGAARHTYRFRAAEAIHFEEIFRQLIKQESLLLQEFQHTILSRGEVAYMLFDGNFSHAVLKRARPGDFRVQDDFGGTIHPYTPSAHEIAFAEQAVRACRTMPVYARVDVMWDNTGNLCVSELELIEPELWFRLYPPAAEHFAQAVVNYIRATMHGCV